MCSFFVKPAFFHKISRDVRCVAVDKATGVFQLTRSFFNLRQMLQRNRQQVKEFGTYPEK